MQHIQVTNCAELPNLQEAKRIILDYETDSGKPERAEAYPWLGAKIAVIAISDGFKVWTICTDRCKRGSNRLAIEPVLLWLRATLAAPRERIVAQWIRIENMLSRADGVPLNPDCQHYCTEIAAHHVHDTMEEYNLKFMAAKLLHDENPKRLEGLVHSWLIDSGLGHKSKPGNYAEVPTPLLSVYAAHDVIATANLERYFEAQISEDEAQRACMHQDFEANKIFTDMQYEGVAISYPRLMAGKIYLLMALINLAETINWLIEEEVNPMSNRNLKAILIDKFGLPILRWTNETQIPQASFDYDTLQLYLELEPIKTGKCPVVKQFIQCVDDYRQHKKLLGFIEQYLELQVNGRVHSSVHPCRARGGRTTCVHPNMQQAPPEAKVFILPDEGCGWLDEDASQIEYRWAGHYMKDVKLLTGFRDRKFDQHKFVQEWLGIERRAAKVLNFGTAFNMGAKKLAHEYAIMSGGKCSLEQAKAILDRYFTEIMPFLSQTRRDVENTCKARGFIRNFFGRHSHLNGQVAYKAFNRIVQGSAADMVKNRMIAVKQALKEKQLDQLVRPRLMVHDELLYAVPLAPEIARVAIPTIHNALEGFDQARTPMYWEGGWSRGTWADVAAVKDDKARPGAEYGGVTIKTWEEMP